MSWYLNISQPKISKINEIDLHENLWKACPTCKEMIFGKEWMNKLCVCPICNYHEKISAFKRIELLADEDSIHYLDIEYDREDPIKFSDRIQYTQRLSEARKQTGMKDAALVAEIEINSIKTIVFVMDFAFIGGSMGGYVGAIFAAASELAIQNKCALIAITSSGGARMQEGIISLMQMPKTLMYVKKMEGAKIPYIVVLTDPTTGGVMASFAMAGDITIAEPNALIGFTGPRVIEETMRVKLEPDFQKSEFQLKYGFIDQIVERKNMKNELAKILSLFAS